MTPVHNRPNRRITQRPAFALTLALLTTIATALGAAPTVHAQVEPGDSPEFTFTTQQGTEVTNDTLGAQIVILEFWATWCGPCLASMPHLQDLYSTYHPMGVEIHGICVDDDPDAAQQWLTQNNLPWPVTLDGGWDNLAQTFGVTAIPHCVVLSPQAQVLWAGHPMHLDETLLDGLIREHLPEQAADRPTYDIQTIHEQTGQLTATSPLTYDGKFVETFTLDLPAADRITLHLNSTSFDAYLAVHTPAGQVLTNDDAPHAPNGERPGTNAAVTLRDVAAGSYTLHVTSFAPHETGTWSLTATRRVLAQNP